MATFDKYQIALDIARFTNIIHDGVDALRHLARNQDPDSGVELVLPETVTDRLSFIQTAIRGYSNAALVNYNALTDYISKVTLAEAKTAVTVIFGVDADILQDELTTMRNVAQYAYNNVLSANNLNQLLPFADYVDANVPKWKSIRRRWAL